MIHRINHLIFSCSSCIILVWFFQFFFLQDFGRLFSHILNATATEYDQHTKQYLFIQFFFLLVLLQFMPYFLAVFFILRKTGSKHEHSNTADVLFMLDKIFNSRIYRWKMPKISENGKHRSYCRQTAPFSKHCNTMILWHFWAIFFIVDRKIYINIK